MNSAKNTNYYNAGRKKYEPNNGIKKSGEESV